jgi:tetratricopeptide (TPR) repeat protein
MSPADAETDPISRVAFPESKREIDELFDRVKASMFGAAQSGVLLDRYRVVRTVGRGGLGVVYLAHDPELDREVAVKVARVGRAVPMAALEESVRREARALARVDHPNVVKPFSVERADASLVLVMEYVRGRTLREHMRERPSSRVLVAWFRRIALGLHAAHEAGVVHRDFKPENVMIDERGSPRVLDFGLASAVDPERRDRDVSSGVLGTLPYMAPEQLRGTVVDARADQFAFCVTMFEALSGDKPFPHGDVVARLTAIAEGPPTRPSSIERSLYACIVRGMDPDPSRRWPSMAELERRLGRADTRAAWRGPVLLGCAVGVGVLMVSNTEDTRGCTSFADDLDIVWNADAATRGREHFAHAWTPHADAAWHRVEGQLDDYAARWRTVLHEACEARVGAAVDCLAARLPAVARMIDALATGARPELESAMVALAELPPPHACLVAGPDSNSTDHALSPAELALASELDDLRAVWISGREREVVDRLRERATRSESTDPRLRAELLLHLADYSLGLVQIDLTIAWASEAYELAADGSAPVVAARASAVLGAAWAERGDLARAEDWTRTATAAMIATPMPILARLDVMRATALVHERQGHDRDAIALQLAAFGAASTDPHVPPLELAGAHARAARALANAGDLAQAEALAHRGLDLAVEQLGADHPALASHHLALGMVAAARRDWATCVDHQRIAARTPPAGASWVTGAAMGELGGCLWRLDRRHEAVDVHEEAVAIQVALAEHGGGLASLQIALHNLGAVLRTVHRLDDAETTLRRADTLGQEHGLSRSGTLVELARVELERERPSEARVWAQHAEEALRGELNAGARQPARTLLALAEVLHLAGDRSGRDRIVAEIESTIPSLQRELDEMTASWD